MNGPFEQVHTVHDYYDGPRSGVADFNGRPVFYRSMYLDTPTWNPNEDRFELSPISPAALKLAIEDFHLWQRWQEAELAGTAPKLPDGAERVLPADAVRHAELMTLLDPELRIDPANRILVTGEFRVERRAQRPAGVFSDLVVCWTAIDDPPRGAA
jgi:hypothetical protein